MTNYGDRERAEVEVDAVCPPGHFETPVARRLRCPKCIAQKIFQAGHVASWSFAGREGDGGREAGNPATTDDTRHKHEFDSRFSVLNRCSIRG